MYVPKEKKSMGEPRILHLEGTFPLSFRGEVGDGGHNGHHKAINLKLNKRHIPPTIIARESQNLPEVTSTP